MCGTEMPTGHFGVDHVAPAFHPDGTTTWRCVNFHACAGRIAEAQPRPRTAGGRELSEHEMRQHAWGLLIEKVHAHRERQGISQPGDR
jgi:hypothetical protein